MQLINKSSRTLILILGLFAGMAWGALPDPVEFAWIVERGDIKRVTTWLDEGLDPEFQGSQIGSGLMIAAWHGNIPMMALIVGGSNPVNDFDQLIMVVQDREVV